MSEHLGTFTFFTAHNALAYHPKMNLNALRLFDRIDFLANKKGYCWAQNDDLAYFSAQSEQLIDKNLKLLEDLEFINRKSVKEAYLNQTGRTKFKTVRRIYVTLDKNIIPDYVPTTENRSIIDNSNLDNPPIQNLGMGTIQNRGVSNSTTYNNTKLSKDSKRVSPSTPCEVPFLLEEWRTKEQVPIKQHHPKENSKVHKKINMLSTLLMKGKFAAHCDLDPKFLSSCNLTKLKLNRKFSKDELLAGLDEMADMFKLNNLPEDKTAIRNMSFDSLIYHPIAKMSYLLKYMYTDTKPLEYKTIEVYSHWIEKLYEERIFDRDIENDNHQFGILKKGLAGIEEYYTWVIKNPMNEQLNNGFTLINSEDKFFNFYIVWLNEHPIGKQNPYFLGPQKETLWYRFIKWLEEAIHGDFVHQFPTLNRKYYGK